MNITKFYIRLNGAYVKHHYWSQPAQNWTANPTEATLFETREAANDEATYATAYGPGEAEVCERRTTKTQKTDATDFRSFKEQQ